MSGVVDLLPPPEGHSHDEEGDDHDEPVADAVRGILDGHIVLDRAIAEAGRYPAINVLRSVSRALPRCNSGGENAVIEAARRSS